MIPEFVQRSPATKVIFRPGACAQLGEELAELGVRRPLVLTGRRTAASPAFERSIASLQDFLVFKDIPEHSSLAALEAVTKLAREQGVDGFVAIGGGSASDTAKVAALWLAERGELESHATRFTPPSTLVIPSLTEPKLPIAAVPCTASGAEVGPGAGVRTPDGRKLIFADLKLASRLIVLDPAANTAVPASIMLATGMNGLAHCIEGLVREAAHPGDRCAGPACDRALREGAAARRARARVSRVPAGCCSLRRIFPAWCS